MEICEETLEKYLKTHTDLFHEHQPISISFLTRENDSYVDGYINYIYAARQADKSFIIKHSKDRIISDIDLGLIDPKRNYLEYMTFRLREGLAPQMVPEVYFADQENHLFIMEDLSNQSISRFFLSRGKQDESFGRNIGEFLARIHYFTSKLNLADTQFSDLADYFENPDMSRIITDFIMQPPLQEWAYPDAYTRAIHRILKKIWTDPLITGEWKSLVASFSKRQECLIHGDFHTSNVFIGAKGIRVIDMEYTTMGPFAYDLGYFLANLLSQFAAFQYNNQFTEDFRNQMANYLLQMIHDVFTSYFDHFRSFYLASRGTEDLTLLFQDILQDALGYLAMANISRTANPGAFPDFDCIAGRHEWFTAKALSMKLSESLLTKKNNLRSADDVIDLIRNVCNAFSADLFLQKI